MLIATEELSQHLNDDTWLIFDCRHDLQDHERGARSYREGHVPGAFFAAVETELSGSKTGANGRHPLPRAEDFAAFLNRHGATPTTQIIAYDDVGGQYAARLWWLARWIGVRKAAVLDGGFPKWSAEGRPVTTAIPSSRGKGNILPRANATDLRNTPDVLAVTTAGGGLVLDARAPERFRGEIEPIDKIAGHIPTARNRFFKANLRADATFRPAAELRKEFKALLGSVRSEEVIHQCGSGVTACVNLLAMEYAGLPGSKLYPGSWSEWIADPARPVARG